MATYVFISIGIHWHCDLELISGIIYDKNISTKILRFVLENWGQGQIASNFNIFILSQFDMQIENEIDILTFG